MLQMAGGMSANTQVALKDVSKFDKCFKKFQINVHRLDCGKLKKIHSGKNNKTDSLNVFYHDNHFYPIVNFKAFIGVSYICEYCDFATSNQLFHHVCKAKCFFLPWCQESSMLSNRFSEYRERGIHLSRLQSRLLLKDLSRTAQSEGLFAQNKKCV